MSQVVELEVTAPFATGGAGVGVTSRVTHERECAMLAEERAAAAVTMRPRARALALEASPELRSSLRGFVAFAPCRIEMATGPRP
ncbi:hypothetical protein [Sorangium sp. So ce131]|uniref:hypothetical protein n=1 Tax=Sorangium sp. So ce131 TaxID=3133282 RepID=UPI003F611C7A